MSDIAIKVENLGKLYRLGEVGTGTISHDLNRWLARIRGKEDPFAKIGESNDRTKKGDSDYVWALKDVNFEVKQGEVLGIIGRNGAGKSTLLKLLSKVTQPTSGNIKVQGRIASLLEVGTGFHPEMTGRENVFLNGAIMGMTKREIKAKFDEIVDFAGVERYVDTPVKRYSSGMYVRLAFAVAAFLEPEILIVDEVLAVGDAEFQKKCLGRMKDVSTNDGRTVLFVSHNMAAVQNLCTHGLLMRNGTVVYDGNIDSTIDQYLNSASVNSDQVFKSASDPNKSTQILLAKICNRDGHECQTFGHDEDAYLELRLKNIQPKKGLRCCVGLFDMMETLILIDKQDITETGEEIVYKIKFPGNYLVPNTFKVSIAIDIPKIELIDALSDFLSFTIEDLGTDVGKYGDKNNGLVYPNMRWEVVS
jgi:lipopolysaccharide transport system ATP-binding protein